MKSSYYFLFLLAAGQTAFASNISGTQYFEASNFDFVAPVVSDTSDVYNKQTGLIIYDSSTNGFKGWDATGNWQTMTLPSGSQGNVTSSSTGVQVIESAYVADSCSSSPCTLVSNTAGIQTITRSSAGRYVINFASGTFSQYPSCVVMQGTNLYIPFFTTASQSATAFSFGCNNTGGSAVDCGFHVICMGAQ